MRKYSCKFQENVCFLIVFFVNKKIAFKSSLDLYFHPSISEFRMEEKIHTKVLSGIEVPRGTGRRIVPRGTGRRIFLGEIKEGVIRNLLFPVKLYQRI